MRRYDRVILNPLAPPPPPSQFRLSDRFSKAAAPHHSTDRLNHRPHLVIFISLATIFPLSHYPSAAAQSVCFGLGNHCRPIFHGPFVSFPRRKRYLRSPSRSTWLQSILPIRKTISIAWKRMATVLTVNASFSSRTMDRGGERGPVAPSLPRGVCLTAGLRSDGRISIMSRIDDGWWSVFSALKLNGGVVSSCPDDGLL